MAVIFWSLLTFGIYDLFWLVSVKKELNAKTNVKTPSVLILFAPIGIVFIGAIIGAIATSNVSDKATAANIVTLIVYAVAIFAFLPIYFLWFFKFSKSVSVYTNGELSTAVNMLLLWMLRFVGMAIMQDKFNDMIAAGQAPKGETPPQEANITPAASAPVAEVAPAVPTSDSPQPTVAPSEPQPENNQQNQNPTLPHLRVNF